MSDFFVEKKVLARKVHRCEHCTREIAIGERHHRCAQVYDGQFHAYREHEECRDAFLANRELSGVDHYEPSPFLIDDDWCPEAIAWLKEDHPIVYGRMRFRDES